MGEQVADAIRLVEESGLDYQVTAMDTIVEGEWEQVMGLIHRCVETMHDHSERVFCDVKIDDWSGKEGLLEEKVRSVERAIGHEVKK
jgi:uncharacterized protein (TIGR00106 family)